MAAHRELAQLRVLALRLREALEAQAAAVSPLWSEGVGLTDEAVRKATEAIDAAHTAQEEFRNAFRALNLKA